MERIKRWREGIKENLWGQRRREGQCSENPTALTLDSLTMGCMWFFELQWTKKEGTFEFIPKCSHCVIPFFAGEMFQCNFRGFPTFTIYPVLGVCGLGWGRWGGAYLSWSQVKIELTGDKVRESRLRWFEHVHRSDSGYMAGGKEEDYRESGI